MAKKTLTLKQYRLADLIIFLVILCAFEATIGLLAKQWKDTLYFVSLLYAIVAIVIMRWGGWGAIHCILGAVVQCAVLKADYKQYLAYIVGNSFAMLVLLLRQLVGSKRVRDNVWLTLAYMAIIYASVCLGRTVMLAVLKSQAFFPLLLQIFATDVLSFILALVIVFIARKQNGLFEDQKQYLIRTEEEKQKKPSGDFLGT